MRISSVERPSSGFLSILLQKRVLMVSCREAICADAAAPFSKEHGIKVAGIIGRVFLFTHRRHLHIALRIDLFVVLGVPAYLENPRHFRSCFSLRCEEFRTRWRTRREKWCERAGPNESNLSECDATGTGKERGARTEED